MGNDGAVAASSHAEASQQMGIGCELQKCSPRVLSLKHKSGCHFTPPQVSCEGVCGAPPNWRAAGSEIWEA